ncbi:hypothetical protein [Halomonas sp. 25-S5]|uniref:hypothetical protein n=1 Tax=Halomonas sp. 25-S5 TaxID=2994065 RepID=UPI002468B5D9|nr:hypothetical protein [Halomonas sp. 25-S5]
MTDISKEVQQCAATVSADVLLRRMDYRAIGPNARQRLSRVLADPQLGLAKSEYDFHFASLAFSEALCRAMAMGPADYLAALDAIEKPLKEARHAYKPWLFVDTGFKRADRPGTAIFVLAIMESKRRIRLPPDTFRLPWEQQLQRAQQAVRRHMAESGGELPLWGHIQRYLFCYAEDRKLELSTSGEVLGNASGMGISQASITLKGKPVSFLTAEDDEAT